MKKKLAELMTQILVLGVLFAIMCGCSYVESHYTRKDCVVTAVEQRLVTVVDKTGHEWCYYMDSEDYADVPSVGTAVDIHMFTNNTDSYIYDDEIVRVSTH